MDASEDYEYTFAELLKQFRVRERMSQQQLARAIGVHRNTISAWERGEYPPETLEMVQKVAEALSLSPKDERILIEATRERTTLRIIWNVPHPRNPLFTGREAVLAQLQKKQNVALTQTQAIHGLGGIGKTQTAVEYAHRHRNDYQAIMWVQADTQDTLISGFVSLAGLLRLPERNEQEQQRIVDAVKQWLGKHTKWLLILDNVEDMRTVKTFLPTTYSGHVLLTTRSQALGGIAQGILLKPLEPDEGVLFLLRRATIIALDVQLEQAVATDVAVSREIYEELGGLPLALDQAGAYIEETQCGFTHYLQLYRRHRASLLERRGRSVTDYPESVATTWSLSFEKVEQQNSAAADLLRLCAFLHPDAIAEEIITEGAVHLGPVLGPVAQDSIALDETIAALGDYSLLRRDAGDKTFSIHRLVQAVLKDAMDDGMRRQWAERAVLAVNETLLDVEFSTWERWERSVLSARACATWIEQEGIHLPEAAGLLRQTGWYLTERVRYKEAEPLLQGALAIQEQHLEVNHPDMAHCLNNLANLYYRQGRYGQAEPLFVRALDIYRAQLGMEYSDTAGCLNNLALLYAEQGKYAQAEALYLRVLKICEQQLGADHPYTGTTLNNIGLLYLNQGRHAEAEPLLQRALSIREQQLGADHPYTATTLNNLALVLYYQEKYVQAEAFYTRALKICKQQLGADHPDTAATLNGLALLAQAQGRHAEAEPLYLQALSIYEQQSGPEHFYISTALNNLAHCYQAQGKYEQAEQSYTRGLLILERVRGSQHPHTRAVREHYVSLLRAMGCGAEARQEKLWDEDTPPLP